MEKVFSLWDSEKQKPIQVYAKKTGQEWKAPCSKHNDTNPSLSINEEKGLYICFGCGFKGSLYDPLKSASQSKQKKIIATYDYTDPEGNLLFQTVRYDPKDFRQRRPDGNGGWIWNLEEIETVLYRLPNIVKAEEVLIVEGEKDADSLRLLGFCGTTCPMGAGKWRPHFNKVLEGKNIILCPHNDEPGRKHMAQVAESLNGTAKSLKWINLPGLQEKGDVTDFILKYSDPEEAKKEISRLIEQAPFYKASQEIPDKLHYKITTIDEILNYPDPLHLISEIIIKEILIIIASYAGVGKSIIALSIAKAFLTGQPLWGKFPVLEQGSVLLIDEETPRPFLKERIPRMRFDRGLPFYVIHFQGVKIDTDEGMEALEEALDKINPKVLIIDSFIRIHSADENKTKDMARVMDRLRKIVNRGLTVILIAHHGKGQDRPAEEKLRGVSEIPAGIDIEYSVVDKSDGEAGVKILEFKSVKTRTKPVDPILLKLTFPENPDSEITVEYQGTRAEDALEEVKNILREKEIDGQLISGNNGATFSKIEDWLREREAKVGQKTLRVILKGAVKRGEILSKQDRFTRGKPMVYWMPEEGFLRK